MADGITLSVKLVAKETGATIFSAKTMDIAIDTAGAMVSTQTVTVGTGATELKDGSVVLGGLFVIKNLSAVKVFLGDSAVTTATAACAVGPSEIATFRIGAVELYAVVATETALVQVTFCDP